MIHCCEGHVTRLMLHVEADDVLESDYITWLNETEAHKLFDAIEGGDCPVCNGLIPFQKELSTKSILV